MVREERLQPLGVCARSRRLAHRRRLVGRLTAALLALTLTGAAPARADAPEAVRAARAALWGWDLDGAEALLKSVPKPARAVLQARLDLQRSRFKAVDKRLTPLLATLPAPLQFEARVVLGRALYASGQRQRAFAVVDQLGTDYNNDVIAKPEELKWLAVGLHLTDYPKDALRIFEEVLAAAPDDHETRLLMAELLLHKYNWEQADQLVQEILAKRPDDPRALIARGRIDIESDRDYAAARQKAEKVLAAAPSCVPAHNLLARVDLDNERPGDAIARLEAHSLKTAPADPDALTLLGAAHFLLDDTAAFKATTQRALAANPRFAGYYAEVAAHAARMHRYTEALGLATKALALDPEHWSAYAQLGIGYGRVGDDAKANEYLNKAFDGDPYDVRTYNLLEFFYDKVIKQFEWVDAGKIKVRVHKSERPILERYVPALLSEAYAFLVKKYRFEPAAPVHVEIFHDPQLFAIRSTGLPRLGAHGICFGHVITARSPSAGNFNWAEVVWHELSHVFHIQLSKSRVPRWFTEGMAVYEETEARPEWRREMDAELLAYLDRKKLRGIAEFNLSFTRAKSMKDILVAYYHAYVVADFIAKEFGFDRMRAMLVAWGERKATPQVFEQALGVSLEAFDKRFFGWLDKRLDPLRKSFAVDLAAYAEDADKLLAAAEKAGDDAVKLAHGAAAALTKRDLPRAEALVERALVADDEQPMALLIRSGLRLQKGNTDGAREDLEKLLDIGRDGVEIRQRLARLARQAGALDDAVEHLEKALALDPQQGRLYYAVIELLDKLGRGSDAYAWRQRALQIDQMNVKLVDELLAGAKEHGASADDVLRWGAFGNHIAPFSVAHHLAFARELVRLGRGEQAVFEAKSALLIEPDNAEAKKIVGG